MFLWRPSLGNNETSSSSLQAFECLSLRVLLMDQCDTITNQMHLNTDNVESAARNRGHSCLVQTERRRLSSVFVINLIEASPCGFVRHSVRSVCCCALARCCWLQDAEPEIRTVWSFLSWRNFADGQKKKSCKTANASKTKLQSARSQFCFLIVDMRGTAEKFCRRHLKDWYAQ